MKVPVFLRGVFCGVCRVFCRVCEWLDGASVRKAVGAGRPGSGSSAVDGRCSCRTQGKAHWAWGAELSVGAEHAMDCAGKRSPEVGDAVHGSAGVVGGGVGRLASCAMIDFVLYERLRRLGILDCGVRGHNVGASDYSRHVIQPWSIWLDYELNPWDADIVKRVLRTKDGESRRLDYEKIIHICQERIRQLGG